MRWAYQTLELHHVMQHWVPAGEWAGQALCFSLLVPQVSLQCVVIFSFNTAVLVLRVWWTLHGVATFSEFLVIFSLTLWLLLPIVVEFWVGGAMLVYLLSVRVSE